MEKQEFYTLVEQLFVPLFTGSFLAGETDSTARDMEVALGKTNSILLKPTKADDYRLVLKRSQPFKSFEVELVKSILKELNLIYAMEISDKMYLSKLQNMAIEKALVNSISENASETILAIIARLEKWASRTYEGSMVKLGVLVNLTSYSEEDISVNVEGFFENDFSATFTDGITTFVEFDRNGNLIGYANVKNAKNVPTISPYIYDKVARVCNDKRVGIVLTEKGDILIFYARQLIFAKRNGHWCIYSHEEGIRLLYNNIAYTAKEIRRAIYNTALDCSFAYKGACIAYINKDKTRAALKHIDVADIVSESHFELKKQIELEEADNLFNLNDAKQIIDKYSFSFEDFIEQNNYLKTIAIRKIIAGKKLYELDRKLVEEMTSIDGATIVDYDGTIVAVGAIIKIEAGSQGGGRLAAATTMAKYGVSIKVSQDGIMQGFSVDKHGKVKQIFFVG